MASYETLFCRAETENGEVIDDPSEDAIYMLLEDLNTSDNTFVTIEPVAAGANWYVSISLLRAGVYEVEYRDADRREDAATVRTDRNAIAGESTSWIAWRRDSRRPASGLLG